VGASKIGPEVGDGGKVLHLVLYDRALLDRMNKERAKARADTRSLLTQEPTSPSADGTTHIDISAYMVDRDDCLSGTGADGSDPSRGDLTAPFDGLMSVKVQAGRNTSQSYRLPPSDTLQSLLNAYAQEFPATDMSRARFIFDGDCLRLNQSLEDAGLEDGDQVELRL